MVGTNCNPSLCSCSLTSTLAEYTPGCRNVHHLPEIINAAWLKKNFIKVKTWYRFIRLWDLNSQPVISLLLSGSVAKLTVSSGLHSEVGCVAVRRLQQHGARLRRGQLSAHLPPRCHSAERGAHSAGCHCHWQLVELALLCHQQFPIRWTHAQIILAV